MMKRKLFLTVTLLTAAMMSSGCATISEDECAAGNWSDIGYKDGLSGTDRYRLTNIVEKCAEFGFNIDRSAYLQGYETGLDSYCVPDRFYDKGLNGSSYNEVCSPRDDGALRAAYEEGRQIYEIEREHERLVKRVDSLEDQLADVRARIADEETTDEERDRLRKKRERLEDDLDNARYDLRAHRRKYNLY